MRLLYVRSSAVVAVTPRFPLDAEAIPVLLGLRRWLLLSLAGFPSRPPTSPDQKRTAVPEDGCHGAFADQQEF